MSPVSATRLGFERVQNTLSLCIARFLDAIICPVLQLFFELIVLTRYVSPAGAFATVLQWVELMQDILPTSFSSFA